MDVTLLLLWYIAIATAVAVAMFSILSIKGSTVAIDVPLLVCDRLQQQRQQWKRMTVTTTGTDVNDSYFYDQARLLLLHSKVTVAKWLEQILYKGKMQGTCAIVCQYAFKALPYAHDASAALLLWLARFCWLSVQQTYSDAGNMGAKTSAYGVAG